MTTLDLTIRASTYGKTPTALSARVHEFTRAERVRRGLRAFLPWFGAGCGMLILPPHVVWLATWTTVGVVFGRKRYRQLREFVSLRGACPDCGKTEDLKLPDALPAIQRCASCGAFLKLEDTETAAPLG
ncbi:MAG TPA: hypothetical protein VMR86_19930 [Myxococcota bacterium]|nr:hypothetical protein [Myxococcota bacterium]